MFPRFLLQNSVETSLVVLVVEYFTLLLHHSVGMHGLNRIKASIRAKSLLKIWDIYEAYCLALHCYFYCHLGACSVYMVTMHEFTVSRY